MTVIFQWIIQQRSKIIWDYFGVWGTAQRYRMLSFVGVISNYFWGGRGGSGATKISKKTKPVEFISRARQAKDESGYEYIFLCETKCPILHSITINRTRPARARLSCRVWSGTWFGPLRTSSEPRVSMLAIIYFRIFCLLSNSIKIIRSKIVTLPVVLYWW